MKKIIIFSACLFVVTSCTKTELPNVTVPKTFEELQQIVLTDPNINNLVESSNVLISLKNPRQSMVLTHTAKITTSSISSNDVNNYFSGVKNKSDLAIALGKVNVANSDSVASKIDYQIQNVIAFANHYPEVRKLSKNQIELLFTSALNAKGIITTNLMNIVSLKVLKVDACNDIFNASFNSCTNQFGYTLVGIWGAALIGSSEVSPVGAVIVALIASGVAYLIWGDCVDTAGIMFDICYNN